MDFTTTRAIDITHMALNGLATRQRAIASNTANAMTPNYQRKDIVFEDQLKNFIEKDNIRKDLKMLNSTKEYTPEAARSMETNDVGAPKKLNSEQLAFLAQNDYGSYSPQIIRDVSQFDPWNQNNVEVEKEMTDMAKTGIKFNVLATLENKMLQGISDVIKGGGAN